MDREGKYIGEIVNHEADGHDSQGLLTLLCDLDKDSMTSEALEQYQAPTQDKPE